MPKFTCTLHVFRKSACVNEEEKPIFNTLHFLGHKNVTDYKKGVCMLVTLDAENAAAAKSQVERMCVDGEKYFLANPVMERYEVYNIEQLSQESNSPAEPPGSPSQ